jgi:hypothetical protein
MWCWASINVFVAHYFCCVYGAAVYLRYCCLQLTLAFHWCLQILVFGKLLNIYYTVIQFLIICLGFIYRQTFISFIYIYNVSYHVKGEISSLMLYRVSIWTVLVQWPDDGSFLEPKLVARKTFTSNLLGVTDKWINIHLWYDTPWEIKHKIYVTLQNLLYFCKYFWLHYSL